MGLRSFVMCETFQEIWSTTGTVATTHQITGPGTPGQPDGPSDLVNFDSSFDINSSPAARVGFEVLFRAFDGNNQFGLWVSNGTGAGTHEITGISGASPFGLDPVGMTVLPGRPFVLLSNEGVLFAGFDANAISGRNLWVTDGTAAGTHELAVQNASANGLIDRNRFAGRVYTSFDGSEYFEGLDANDLPGLWVTDGTGPGTHLVTNGSDPDPRFSFDPRFITAFNFARNEMLFAATNSVNGFVKDVGLWVSDGTATGTHELTGINGASSQGLFNGYFDPYSTQFSSSGMLFDGLDVNNQFNLWVTDGTAAGTHELTGISGAATTGLTPQELTAFHGGVLFRGIDASGNRGLWITNGTAAGTHELTGISGAAADFDPTHFTSAPNGEVLFSGLPAAGGGSMWETDGTAAGTRQIDTLVSPVGAALVSVPPPEDFRGNLISDVLFRKQATGEVDTWLMNNGQVNGGSALGSVSSAWRFVGTGDITGNGTSDVLWQNTSTGAVESWLMNNGNLSGGGGVGYASSAWQPLGTGQFNGDGISDLLWRNINTGEVDVWLMNNGQVTAPPGGQQPALGSVSSAWQFAGIGDFNGDGISDVLWHNTTTGEVDTWLVNVDDRSFLGSPIISGGSAIGVASSAWQALGTGDFLGGLNSNGSDDILWRNTVTGEVDTWIMNNGQVVGGTALGSVSSAWQFAGIGDYNGSSTSSVLWRNVNTGEVDTWIISNDRVTGGSGIGTASSAWQPQVIHTG